MTELPKIVKSRLRQQQGAGVSPHPDANLLAAFTEQALPPGEREQVLAHLAVCAECREITALSAPGMAVTDGGAAASRGFLGLPPDFFRWGIVAASAAVVVAAVLLVKPEFEAPLRRESATVKVEAEQPGPLATGPAANKDEKPVERKLSEQKAAATLPARSAPPQAKNQPVAPPPSIAANTLGGGTANAIVAAPPAEPTTHAPARTNALSGAVRNGPMPPASAPAPLNDVAQGGAGTYAFSAKETRNELKVVDANPAPAGKADSVGGQAAKKDEAPALAGARSRDAKGLAFDGAADSASTVEVTAAAPTPQTMKLGRAIAKTADSPPRTWRINDGRLEWSLDAGSSWQPVNAPGGARFLSVDSRASNVWAGSAAGVVVRSLDNGATWAPVKPGLTGAVVYLKFDDEKRGTLKTSTGEEWSTLDGGESWRKK